MTDQFLMRRARGIFWFFMGLGIMLLAAPSFAQEAGSGDHRLNLSFEAPSENVDGTPLTDLAGYVVYWGTSSRNYTAAYEITLRELNDQERDFASIRVAPGTYYVAMTAVDAEGNESAYSNEVRKETVEVATEAPEDFQVLIEN